MSDQPVTPVTAFPMKKGTRVKWYTHNFNGIADLTEGHGITIADEDDTGHILVADMSSGEKHHVIWCTVTWLTSETP